MPEAAAAQETTPSTTDNPISDGVLYRHTLRPEWGLAILAWEHDGKRGYRFEDGTLRIFKRGFFKLFDEVDVDIAKTRALSRALHRDADRRATSEATAAGPAAADQEDRVALSDQIDYFTDLFAKGFRDPHWQTQKRGAEAGRRLKRHRQSAIDDARKRLASTRMAQAIESGDHQGAMDDLLAVLDSTDLVGKKRVDAIRELDAAESTALLSALRALLWDDGSFAVHFDAWLSALRRAMGTAASWELATAPLALVHPDKHVCVRRSTFRAQAAYMSPRLRIDLKPSIAVYQRCLEMARRVMERLRQSGLEPDDLLDIHDFMRETLRPQAQNAIAAKNRSQRMSS